METLIEFFRKIGHDKFDHHVLGAEICSFFSTLFILQEGIIDWNTTLGGILIGLIATIFAAIIKEFVIDEKADWRDIVATVSGCIWPLMAVVLGVFFNQFSI